MVLAPNERGVFGSQGLDTPVDQLLDAQEIRTLTADDDPAHPRCPALIGTVDRLSDQWETVWAQCPNLGRVTLRHLLRSNHGMFDAVDEIDRNQNQFPDSQEIAFASVLRGIGVEPVAAPAGC